MVRIAVIDDDKDFSVQIAEIARAYLVKSKQKCEIKCYSSPREFLWDLEENISFDIYLIDVEMPGINGLELAQQIRLCQLRPYLIFISSYMEYSLNGYEYRAFRYILKEEVAEKLPAALAAVMKQLKYTLRRQYMIETHSKVVKMDYDDIYYLHVDGKYTYFHTRRGMFRERMSLHNVFHKLQGEEFMFVDKGSVVNLKHVLELNDRMAVMRDRVEIPVSRPQYQKLKKALSSYWRRQL